ncbi:MAG: hypothetical protein IPP34_11450 [Bacteroidetes bacterium]|nr:hypothetical protein [Bacteroidota bacterium]
MDNLSNQYVTGYFNSDSIEVGGQILYKQSNPGFSTADMFIAKFNPSGSLQWIQQIVINDSILNIPFGITIKDNYLYVAANGRQGIVRS